MEASGDMIKLTCDDVLGDYQSITKQIKELEKLKESLKEKIYQELGESTVGVSGSYICESQTIKQQRLDSKAFEEAYPEIYRTFLKPTIYKKLIIKERAND